MFSYQTNRLEQSNFSIEAACPSAAREYLFLQSPVTSCNGVNHLQVFANVRTP